MCGSTRNLEVHHLKPLAKGGKDVPENTVHLCKDCHKSLGLHQGMPQRKRSSSSYAVTSLYVGAYAPYWERFKELVGMDRKSASEVIMAFVVDYVNKHDPGNP